MSESSPRRFDLVLTARVLVVVFVSGVLFSPVLGTLCLSPIAIAACVMAAIAIGQGQRSGYSVFALLVFGWFLSAGISGVVFGAP